MPDLTAAVLNTITRTILAAAIAVHRALGPGLLESAYGACLAFELVENNLSVATDVRLPLRYKRVVLGCAYRADIVVNGCVLVEIKAIETVLAVHLQQTRTYLKLGDYRVGLLLNFGETTMKNGIHRIANNFPDQ